MGTTGSSRVGGLITSAELTSDQSEARVRQRPPHQHRRDGAQLPLEHFGGGGQPVGLNGVVRVEADVRGHVREKARAERPPRFLRIFLGALLHAGSSRGLRDALPLVLGQLLAVALAGHAAVAASKTAERD